jgi:hypothetical protein
MSKSVLAALVASLAAGLAAAQPKGDAPTTEPELPPLRYTVRTEQGDRSGRVRASVLKALKMTPDQVRAWAEDAKSAKEEREALLYQDGYAETVRCSAAGELLYTLRDEAGGRSGRDRAALLKTRKMTAEQVKAWATAPEGKPEHRSLEALPSPRAVETITGEKGSVFSSGSKSASEVLAQSDEKIREWAADPKAEKEGRGAILFRDGHVEVIWHGPGGRLLYSVRNEKGSRTSLDRAGVLKTLKMTDDEVLAWVEDAKSAKEFRAATFYPDGHAEVITRGPAFEPPGLGP